jgi:hypothetical protein
MLVDRRGFLIGASALPVAPPAANAQGRPTPAKGRIAFQVVRDGADIGSHDLVFADAASGFDVTIAVDIAVKFGPITAFRYQLNGLEQWRDGKVFHVEASTNDDGRLLSMRADRDERGLWVWGSKAPRYLAPSDALPATHWNEAELRAPWINPQDGRLLHPKVTPADVEQVSLGDDRTVPARRFDISGDARMQIWYGSALGWTALRFTARDSSLIRYVRT